MSAALRRWQAALRLRMDGLSPTARGLVWASASSLLFGVMNAIMRLLTQHVPTFQAQFLRYAFGLLVLLPLLRNGLAHYWPRNVGGQFSRGALHTLGLCLWFTALPRIPLADMTAISFTTPIFIMIGAYFFFGEAMRWERWLAMATGFGGVLIVVGPQLSLVHGGAGLYHLLMLASAPVFAASFLVTKALTRYEHAGTIVVWQAISVSLFSLPLAWPQWQGLPPLVWLGFFGCGMLGSAGHFCLTQSFRVSDISATQSAKFLDLVWSVLMGWCVFGDLPHASTLAGGLLICSTTLWLARRESRPATLSTSRA